MKAFLSKVGNFFVKVGKAIKTFWLEKVVPLFKKVGNWIVAVPIAFVVKIAKIVWNWIVNVPVAFIVKIAKIVGNFFATKVGPACMKVLTPVGKFFAKVFTPVGKFLAKVFTPVGKFLAKYLGPVFRPIGKGIWFVLCKIGAFFKMIFKAIVKKIKANREAKELASDEKRAVARKDITYREYIWREMKKNRAAYALIAPYLLIFTVFTIVPVVISIVISFTDFNMLQWPSFVGLDNYINLFFDDDIFLIACKNTFIFAAIVGPASYLMSFLVAWFINELSPRIRSIVTLIFYAPSISGSVYLIWGTLFSSDSYGWVNATLLELGFITEPVAWFKDASYVMPLCIVVALWTSLGTAFLSFIAGLQGVDRSLYEAGAVDGIKNRWQELWYITLPSMKPQLMFGAVMAITGSFGFGGVVTALCGFPSVDYAAHTIMHHLEDYGNQRYEIGYSSTIAVVLFVIMVVANMIVKKVLSKVGS